MEAKSEQLRSAFVLLPGGYGRVDCGHVQTKTGARGICIVDDPAMKVTAVALLPGASGSETQINALEQDNVQLLIAGEAREWETVPYVQTPLAKAVTKHLSCLGIKYRKKPEWRNVSAGFGR